MSKHTLQNLDNYKTEYTHGITEIYTKYFGIVKEYIIQFIDTIYISNMKYYRYIIIKGLETITHVFKILLLYTKNLNITYNLCQKSLYYYVEFICQIGDDHHSFLQLNSKDASLFVYKKTIFELNNEHRKEFFLENENCIFINNINILIDLYNRYILNYLMEYNFTKSKDTMFIKHIDSTCTKYNQSILNLSLNLSLEEYYDKLCLLKEIDIVLPICNKIKINYIIYIIKKLQKKKVLLHVIKKNISHKNHAGYLKDYTPIKYINWVVST